MGDLLELLGVGRVWPEVFDEMVELLGMNADDAFGGEQGQTDRLAGIAARAKGA